MNKQSSDQEQLNELDGRHEVVERINKKDLKPMYETNHEHQYVRDEDETNDYFAEMCVIKNCNLGRLIAKH